MKLKRKNHIIRKTRDSPRDSPPLVNILSVVTVTRGVMEDARNERSDGITDIIEMPPMTTGVLEAQRGLIPDMGVKGGGGDTLLCTGLNM
jgi:hypothetical protein